MPDAQSEGPRFCSRCGQPVVVAEARFCKECGAPLAPKFGGLPRELGWRPLIAAGLSVVPGLGHLYRGRPARALVWFLWVSFIYAAAPPLGFVMHLACAANAALTGIGRDSWPRTSRQVRSRAWSRP